MRLTDLILGRPRPTQVAAVYANRESAVEAAEAAKDEGPTDDEHIKVVGPLEQLIGNEPESPVGGAWAVVVQPDTYEQSSRIARALRRPNKRRRSDVARRPSGTVTGQSAPAELATNRS